MIRFPERKVSFDRITDLVYLGSRIASLDDYHRLKAEGVRACVDMKQEGADPWTFEAFLRSVRHFDRNNRNCYPTRPLLLDG